MLSDSLDALVQRLLGTSPNAHVVRLTPVGGADAEEACRRGGLSVADKDVERALESAGLDLERRGGECQPRLVWVRPDLGTADEHPVGMSPLCGEDPSLRLTFYRVENAEQHQATTDTQWLVEVDCWRRGPDGSIAVYEISTRVPFQRCFESEIETIDDGTAAEVAGSIVEQVAIQLMPLVVRAVRATQGNDPDPRPERDWLS